jgi:hypothetical protein
VKFTDLVFKIAESLIQNGHSSEWVFSQPLWRLFLVYEYSSKVALERLIYSTEMGINENIAAQSSEALKAIKEQLDKMRDGAK